MPKAVQLTLPGTAPPRRKREKVPEPAAAVGQPVPPLIYACSQCGGAVKPADAHAWKNGACWCMACCERARGPATVDPEAARRTRLYARWRAAESRLRDELHAAIDSGKATPLMDGILAGEVRSE